MDKDEADRLGWLKEQGLDGWRCRKCGLGYGSDLPRCEDCSVITCACGTDDFAPFDPLGGGEWPFLDQVYLCRPCQHRRSWSGAWEGPSRLVIAQGRATWYRHDAPREYELHLDANANPPTWSMRRMDGGGRDFQGIYRVTEDILILCYNSPGRGRPTAFEGPGGGSYTAVYTRVTS
jgi:uncharacterized protein (TIGR03067 family)